MFAMTHEAVAAVQMIRTLNPWWTDPASPFPFPAPPAYRRAIFEPIWTQLSECWERLQLGAASLPVRGVLVAGLRRVGKSTVTQQILEKVRAHSSDANARMPLTQVAYLNVDDARLRGSVAVADLLAAWKPYRNPKRPAVVVIDEVHQLDPAGKPWHRQLKGLAEMENMVVLATGSSASVLRDGAAEAPGRWQLLKLEPLSFREFRELRAGGKDRVIDARRFLDLDHYLAVGGFPELVHLDSVHEAQRRTRERVRQVIDLEVKRNRQTDQIERLHRVLVEESGESINTVNLSKSLGVSRPTIESWIGMLEQALLIQRLWRRGSSALHEIRGLPKVYAVDPGIVAAFARVADPIADPQVRSRLQEAAVLRHLRDLAGGAGFSLHCLQREKRERIAGESDFLLCSSREIFLIEVASHSGLGRKGQQQLELAREIARAHLKVAVYALIVHAGAGESGGPVARVPLADFLERVPRTPGEDDLEHLRSLSTRIEP